MGTRRMNAGWVRWGAAAPAAAYATAVAMGAAPPDPVGTLAVTLAMVVSLGSLVTDRLGSWWFAPATVALGGTVMLAASIGSVVEPPVAPLVLGVLLGTPALALAVFGRVRDSAAWAPMALMGGLVADAFLLAVVRASPSGGGGSAHAWAGAASSVLTDQWASLRAFATGAAIPAPPLSYAGDVLFDALAVVALVGMLLGWLDPVARSVAVLRGGPDPPGYRPPDTVGPTPGLGRSGARSLVVAVGAVLVFELAAALSPSDALLGLAVAAPATVTLTLALTDRRHRQPVAAPP